MANKLKDKDLILPEYDSASLYPYKKCLSSSQFKDYVASPREFFLKHGTPEFPMKKNEDDASGAMIAGRIFSALYQNRSLRFRELLEKCGMSKYADKFERAIKLMPVQVGGHPEYPMICEYRGWKFRATLDDYVVDSFTIIENKTGQNVWTQDRVNEDQQLTFQAWCHLKKIGVLPRAIWLFWVDCRSNPTKPVHSFKTSRSSKALKNFEALVDTVIDNIEAGNFSKDIYAQN